MVDIFRLPLRQRAEGRRLQQIGKADDVGQRRAQLVGHVLDEVVLQLVGHAAALRSSRSAPARPARCR